MKFWKMNGAGNDFIILNNMDENLHHDAFPAIARTLCERHLSIGADGMMVVEWPSEGVDADIRMLFYNSDGTLGEMCGNGARCICRYVYENALYHHGESVQVIETTAGIVTGERISARQYRIRLNDPSVLETHRLLTLEKEELPFTPDVFTDDVIRIPCAYVELGNPGLPHLAVEYTGIVASLCGADGDPEQSLLKEAPSDRLRELGRCLRWHKDLPKGANVNFYEVTGTDTVYERTFERGVEDFTYACGTGTGSVVAVLTKLGRVSGKGILVGMTGGELTVDIVSSDETCSIYLTGPTNIVAKGEVTDEELIL
ncbi:MAG: diaminopimelate epimerase [Lachnospiraceae bacterium]|nr:diaminopimelate epimerase [Lachnospiraceae bacterium]